MQEDYEPEYILVAYGTNDWKHCTKEEFDALGVSGYNAKLADAKKYYNYDYVGGTYEAQ